MKREGEVDFHQTLLAACLESRMWHDERAGVV